MHDSFEMTQNKNKFMKQTPYVKSAMILKTDLTFNIKQ